MITSIEDAGGHKPSGTFGAIQQLITRRIENINGNNYHSAQVDSGQPQRQLGSFSFQPCLLSLTVSLRYSLLRPVPVSVLSAQQLLVANSFYIKLSSLFYPVCKPLFSSSESHSAGVTNMNIICFYVKSSCLEMLYLIRFI